MYVIKSPLNISMGYNKKKDKDNIFILNLNNYRNTFFRTLNQAKIRYKASIVEQLQDKPRYERIMIIYKIHKGDNRRYDIGNILSIHQKFFEDALVETGKLPDDKSLLLPLVVYVDGSVNTDRPRVDVTVYDLNNRSDVAQLKKDILKEIKTKAEN